jgi:hypothetical protein
MAVTGLAHTQDEYMISILTMDLPKDDRVEACGVLVSWELGEMFVATATTTKEGADKPYQGVGHTIKDALLELAAEIVLNYPVEENEEVNINIPTNLLVKTNTFKKWFKT